MAAWKCRLCGVTKNADQFPSAAAFTCSACTGAKFDFTGFRLIGETSPKGWRHHPGGGQRAKRAQPGTVRWYRTTYLKGEHWRTFREGWWERHPGEPCFICGGPASVLHHIDYMRVGQEVDSDVRAVCIPCHRDIHRHHKSHDVGIRDATYEVRRLRQLGHDTKIAIAAHQASHR